MAACRSGIIDTGGQIRWANSTAPGTEEAVGRRPGGSSTRFRSRPTAVGTRMRRQRSWWERCGEKSLDDLASRIFKMEMTEETRC